MYKIITPSSTHTHTFRVVWQAAKVLRMSNFLSGATLSQSSVYCFQGAGLSIVEKVLPLIPIQRFRWIFGPPQEEYVFSEY